MESFLKGIARLILHEHPTDADSTLVVFNNHRSELFLRRAFEAISQESHSSFFLPKSTVIDDLVASLGGLKIVPNEFLLFELFRVHTEIGGPDRKYTSFEEFISFGDTLLADFSEIDRYCVDAHSLFVNLHDQKEILIWDVENPDMSPFQRNYLHFYQSLFNYYSSFRQRLAEKGMAYNGMAYRFVAENITSLADNTPYSQIYFIGFNALSECERRIIGEFARRGIGRLLTDADVYYADNPAQEAGLFLRRHKEEFPEVAPKAPSLFSVDKKEIAIVECPEAVLQCKFAGQLLDDHPDWLDDPESTAVVLADEKLLIPMLNALPDSNDNYKVNISMGFPFVDSATHSLVQLLLVLYHHATPQGYYYADVINLLAHPLVERLTGQHNMRHRTSAFLKQEKRIRCHAADLDSLTGLHPVAYLLPSLPPSPNEALSLLHNLTRQLAEADAFESNKKEQQALASLTEILSFLDDLQADYDYVADIPTLEKIYLRVAQRHNIAFLGQPLSGLQVLGMLETRNLDFKRVILLSANEGILPAARSQNSLIPFELQRHFHLPTYKEKDSVYAYNFYRLIQRASEVYLLFNSDTDSLGKGEESRFIKQVRNELAAQFPDNVHIRDFIVTADTSRKPAPPTLPERNSQATAARLRTMAADGFSPSSLNVYLDCPLQFYYNRILGIRQTDSLNEDLDDSELGTYIHSALQLIYSPCIGRSVSADDLAQALDHLPDFLHEAFSRAFANGRSQEGRNHFLYSVGESQVRHMLRRELDLINQGHQIDIIALEQTLSYSIPSAQLPFPSTLKGTADRIDRFDGILRIIDYKTGKLDDKEIRVNDPDPDPRSLPGKWFQLMCYSLLFNRSHHLSEPLTSGIYPLRYLHSGVRPASWNGNELISPDQVDRFEQLLSLLIADLLDPDNNFDATPASKSCTYCPAKSFCLQAKK